MQSDSVIGTHISNSFFILFPFLSFFNITKYWLELPVLYTVGSLLIIYFIYSSVYKLIANSSFIPPPQQPFPFGNQKFIF